MFEDFHPTETAQNGKPYRDERLRAPGEPTETDRWKCPHCGFYNNIKIENPKNLSGEGTAYIQVSIDTPAGAVTRTEPKRVSGCFLCGHDYTQSTYRKKLFSTVNNQGR